MWQVINFKTIDSNMRFNYPDELYKIITSLKYTYVSEYMYVSYYILKKSLLTISKELGISDNACAYWMKKWDFPRRPSWRFNNAN